MTQKCVRVSKGTPLFFVLAVLIGGLLLAQSDFSAAYAQQRRPQPPPAAAATAAEKPTFEAALKNLRFREIGPAIMGGRIDDFAVVESNPNIVFVATASSGVWKTVNGGTSWEPVFDDQPVSTIGDITVAPSDPSNVWVGTGEPNNRQSSSWGNGVYKSTDAGRSWRNMGLAETHHIGRIVIHPANPNVVYVAAVGRLWGPSKERGLYKTTDGGNTWTNVLHINEDTGIIDVAIDMESPDTLYAAAYQRRRTVWGFNGSGPNGGIHKTTDGGVTWKRLETGLPWDPNPRPAAGPGGGGFGGGGGGGGFAALLAQQQQQQPAPAAPVPPEKQEIGRIGVQVYRGNSNVVYAIVEHRNGGIFRSDNKGETWTKMSDTNPRPMYYSKIHIDPNNDLRIWVLGAQMFYSEDGGRNFRTNRVTRIHGDYHAMWINPANSNHMVVGSDGGIHWSYDAGQSWDYVNTVALGQFYEIGVDMRKPYYVCGGLQDNGSWCGPSATPYQQGISNEDWYRVAGGDGYYVQIDPTDHNIVYAESQDGNPLRRDLRTQESISIRPREEEGDPRYRFQWNTPIVISAHNTKTIYYAGQFVFRSDDRGDNWRKISPDLTTGTDRNALQIMHKVPDMDTRSRHDGVQAWPTISALSESSLDANLLWAGTDDGHLHVTRDGGRNWKNVISKVPGIQSKYIYVSRIVASRHAAGRAYVTFDGHRMNDFNIYVYVTEDFGETWKAIRNGMPDNKGIVNVIREHHRNPDLLVAGTEYGAFVSFDRGANWTKVGMGLPTVPVDDIVIHPRDNDLVFGTHGRSIWILDDISALEQMSQRVLDSDFTLFALRPATVWRIYGHKGNTGHKFFLGQNPPNGALIHYYLKERMEEPQAAPAAGSGTGEEQEQPGAAPQQRRTRVRITIQDSNGRTIRELNGTGNAGINRVVWDLRHRSPLPPGLGPGGGFGGGFGGFGGGQAGSRVDPGTYTVKVSVDGKGESQQTLQVEEDPRITISDSDRAARRKAINDTQQVLVQATLAQRGITGLRQALNTARESWRRPGGPRIPENIQKAAEELAKKIEPVCLKFANPTQCGVGPADQLGAAGPPPVESGPTLLQRIAVVAGGLEGLTVAPTKWQLDQIKMLSTLVPPAAEEVRKLVQEDLVNLNKMMNEAGIPHINVPRPGGPGGGPGMDDADDWDSYDDVEP